MGTSVDQMSWRDPSSPLHERVEALLGAMTPEEKLAQLGSVWVGFGADPEDGDVAPMQNALGGTRDYPKRPRPGTAGCPGTVELVGTSDR